MTTTNLEKKMKKDIMEHMLALIGVTDINALKEVELTNDGIIVEMEDGTKKEIVVEDYENKMVMRKSSHSEY